MDYSLSGEIPCLINTSYQKSDKPPTQMGIHDSLINKALHPTKDVELSFEKIDYLPDKQLETTQLLLNGASISLKNHIRDILKNYDVIKVPASFLGNITLPP
jgi:hypothetical protein